MGAAAEEAVSRLPGHDRATAKAISITHATARVRFGDSMGYLKDSPGETGTTEQLARQKLIRHSVVGLVL
jgi:hypothetical protein